MGWNATYIWCSRISPGRHEDELAVQPLQEHERDGRRLLLAGADRVRLQRRQHHHLELRLAHHRGALQRHAERREAPAPSEAVGRAAPHAAEADRLQPPLAPAASQRQRRRQRAEAAERAEPDGQEAAGPQEGRAGDADEARATGAAGGGPVEPATQERTAGRRPRRRPATRVGVELRN